LAPFNPTAGAAIGLALSLLALAPSDVLYDLGCGDARVLRRRRLSSVLDVPAATARGVIVMNTPFGNSVTTAEHTISLMMSLVAGLGWAIAGGNSGP
jgi:D-3-phosphoglycerate dehydrogenase